MQEVTRLPAREEWMRARDVLAVLPISKTAFYDGISRGIYPAPTKFGVLSRWRKSDIERIAAHGTGQAVRQ